MNCNTTHYRANSSSVPGDPTFEIRADDYADNNKLKAALVQAGGSRAVISGKLDTVREAISTLSWQPGHHMPTEGVVTTDFGWVEANDAFLVPGGRITASGFAPTNDHTAVRVALEGEELARHLTLRPLPDAELRRVKKHIVDDLLRLHGPRVTYSLLGGVGAAVLRRFAPDAAPFGLWLLGLTGAGKSFAAKLAMNFFGDFPVTAGQFGSWGSTPNYLQRQGYFFKDALYLIDDYKPEVIAPYQVVRVLQNYADNTGRGRLKADASTNTTRPIRGLLISTGEDVPEHNASALARSIVIPVPQQAKDLGRGQRCLSESYRYCGILADFIRHIIAEKRVSRFARRVAKLQRYFYKGIAGQQNDSRIAGNFALLGAGFAEMTYYLRDVWPGWKAAVKWFLTVDLKEVRDAMLGMVKEQEPGEVFWSVLASLVEHSVIELQGHSADKGKPVIGKVHYPHPDGVVAGRTDTLYYVSTDLALAEVNKCLRAQGRAELKLTAATLLGHLRRRGRLLDEDGKPVSVDVSSTPSRQLRIAGQARRAFITSRSLLLESEGDQAQEPANTPMHPARTAVRCHTAQEV